MKPSRNVDDALAERAQAVRARRPSRTRSRPVRVGVLAPVDGVLVADQAERGARLRAALIEALPVVLDQSSRRRLPVTTPSGDQPVRIELARGRMLADRLVHHRLRGSRLVRLVVAMAAIADEVDDHVLVEAHAVIEREPLDEHHGLRIVRVHVEDRRFEHLRDVAAIRRRARIARVGDREARPGCSR